VAYELRVTARCSVEDLGEASDAPFDTLAGHAIVEGFRNKHWAEASTVKIVGSGAGTRTIRRLQYGQDNRGAMWMDAENGVLWLCAAHDRHRSGEPDDAFPYFDLLLADGRLYPVDKDYEALFRDRANRLIDSIPEEADRLVSAARDLPGQEVRGHLGSVAVTLVVESVADVGDELFVAVSMREADVKQLAIVLAALVPEAEVFDAWRFASSLPTRGLDEPAAEVAYSTVLPPR